MHLPTRSSTLYGFRIGQLIVAIGFLILVCWCGVHRAWWNNVNGPLAVAVIAAILTIPHSVFNMIAYHRNSKPLSGSLINTIVRVGIEVLLLFVYIAAAGLMLRPRAGCLRGTSPEGQLDNFCYPPAAAGEVVEPIGKFSDQPLTEWIVAIALSFLEILSFLITTFLVFVQDRSSKSTGGASFA